MPIRYVLVRNKLSGESNKYMAHVRPVETVGIEEILDRVVERSSTVGRVDTLAVLEAYEDAIINMVLEGLRVRTSLACYTASIRGNFDGSTDKFDARRHEVRPCVSPGKKLKKAFKRKARVTKRDLKDPGPCPTTYIDIATGTRNHLLTSGGLGRLHGYRLKFDPDDPEQGIFFIAEDKSAARVQSVAENNPLSLIFQVPELASGEYRLEVRATIYDDDCVRTGVLEERLTVLSGEDSGGMADG